jgi:2-polyprenyl-3-methyl-5-hydroxy-6-metoxy-1,4-benzoquinol methylase
MDMKKSVSDIWIGQNDHDASYFSAPRVVERKFFKNILSSRWVISLLKNPAYNTFLDAGCYVGRFGIALASAGKTVTLMDCSELSLRDAEILKGFAEKYYGRLKINFSCDNLERMRFSAGTFDVTFNEGVLEHWLEKSGRVKVIAEMARVTRPGGLVSIRVINGKNWLNNLIIKLVSRSAPPQYRYSLRELKSEMKQAGLKIINADGDTVNDPANWVKSRWMLSFLYTASFFINHLPKFLREMLCPSIFCSGVVLEQRNLEKI